MKSGSVYGPRCQGSYCCGTRVEPGGVARELAERDLADVAALLQLGHVFGDRIVERDLAPLHRLRQQGARRTPCRRDARLNSASDVIGCLRAMSAMP